MNLNSIRPRIIIIILANALLTNNTEILYANFSIDPVLPSLFLALSMITKRECCKNIVNCMCNLICYDWWTKSNLLTNTGIIWLLSYLQTSATSHDFQFLSAPIIIELTSMHCLSLLTSLIVEAESIHRECQSERESSQGTPQSTLHQIRDWDIR